ncbi:UPF0176 protein [Palleronia aestuarii]|uniref:tRNA uridine(34) hydroxylase n=1 Tax=Palleronia aestuarii TaxID=568105 RepID=A0A2W7NF02_9RHOB|nr:rhodanese-related sulfurtransferase [Palleronia aestuarii]PZX18778.1 UPF0176 protein [Palleronia aestuarii]
MYIVAAFYRFAPLDSPEAVRGPLLKLCREGGVTGSILLAGEGVNGTIAGAPGAVGAVIDHLRGWPGFEELAWRESVAQSPPFGRMKVRVKQEIVTLGVPVRPVEDAGTYVPPAEWNALVSAPDVAVIDTRNAFEIRAGRFQGAIDPGTTAFGEFPAWWEANRERFAGKRIAMYCTGGIRCEKSTAYLKARGVSEVFHLEGGILGYLAAVPEAESLWNGECFVFDERVTVGAGLRPGRAVLCRACRHPIAPEDRMRPEYEEGVQCHLCAGARAPEERARFRERERQMRLARARGARHLGPREPSGGSA